MNSEFICCYLYKIKLVIILEVFYTIYRMMQLCISRYNVIELVKSIVYLGNMFQFVYVLRAASNNFLPELLGKFDT